MSTAKQITSFVEALKNSGITISDEARLKDRLVSAVEKGDDLENEFNTVFSNTKASGVSFYADATKSSEGLTKAFKDINFDGFTWRNFLQSLKQP